MQCTTISQLTGLDTNHLWVATDRMNFAPASPSEQCCLHVKKLEANGAALQIQVRCEVKGLGYTLIA